MGTIDKIKSELVEINASIYELEKRKKELQVYFQGYEDAKKESADSEKALTDKIKELEERLSGSSK